MENVNVSGEFGRKPTLEFTDSTPSDELLVEVLHEGDGQVVEPGDTIHCHYLGQVWDGNVFDNSYDRGAPLSFQIGVGMVIRGWDEGLIGQRVGSRVLLSRCASQSSMPTPKSRRQRRVKRAKLGQRHRSHRRE